MADNEHLLFVLGGPKTATTSLCGLLNCHPDTFMMCEVFLNKSSPGRWGRKLISAHPDMLDFFFRPMRADLLENYRRAGRHLAARGVGRAYFGDKFADIDSGFSGWLGDARVIFCVRPLTEWLAKDSIRAEYPADRNLVPLAVQYTKHFLESFLLPRVHHVRMQDFLARNARVVDGIWEFLGLTLPAHGHAWWETIGRYDAGDPKACLNWWKGHVSASVAPQENDTSAEIAAHPFWDAVLPVFNRYYDLAAGGERPRRSEVERDIAALEELVGKFVLPADQAYASAVSRSHNFRLKGEKAQRRGKSVSARLRRLVGLG